MIGPKEIPTRLGSGRWALDACDVNRAARGDFQAENSFFRRIFSISPLTAIIQIFLISAQGR